VPIKVEQIDFNQTHIQCNHYENGLNEMTMHDTEMSMGSNNKTWSISEI